MKKAKRWLILCLVAVVLASIVPVAFVLVTKAASTPKAFVFVDGFISTNFPSPCSPTQPQDHFSRITDALQKYPDHSFWYYSYNGYGQCYTKADTLRSISSAHYLDSYVGSNVYLIGYSLGGA